MLDKGSSDLHITTGTPPQLRIDGNLVPLRTDSLTPVDTKQLCYSIVPCSWVRLSRFFRIGRAQPGQPCGSWRASNPIPSMAIANANRLCDPVWS